MPTGPNGLPGPMSENLSSLGVSIYPKFKKSKYYFNIYIIFYIELYVSGDKYICDKKLHFGRPIYFKFEILNKFQ